MPQKVLKFTGINRKVNEYQNYGACEELINLRPEIGCNRITKPKLEVLPNVEYDSIYAHSFGETTNYILISSGIIKWCDSKFKVFNDITSDLQDKKEISVSSAGNILAVYCGDSATQLIFKFEDDSYKPYNFSLPRIVELTVQGSNEWIESSVTADENSESAYYSAMISAASGFSEKNLGGVCGKVIIGCTYELESGEEIWSTAFTTINAYNTPVIDTSNRSVKVFGKKDIGLLFWFDSITPEGVKKINIYASNPILPYTVVSKTVNSGINQYTEYEAYQLSADDMALDGQLLYYNGSIVPTTYSYGVNYTLEFGKAKLGEGIMPVTSGAILRTGESKSYNNRFHYYKSIIEHIPQAPSVSSTVKGREYSAKWTAFVKLYDKWVKPKCEGFKVRDIENDFFYPMLGVKEMVFIEDYNDGNFRDSRIFRVHLKDSKAYNYSFALDVDVTTTPAADFFDMIQESGYVDGEEVYGIFAKKETNALNVSAQFNPFVFPVEYSYSFGGEIQDVATAYQAISSTQAGQYPLTVFTSNGVYALEQGNGSVLYSNVVPLQPQVIEGRATPTPHGTFFVSSNNLYVLSGRETTNVSYVLNGERELNIRDNKAYKSLCCDATGPLHDFTSLLSNENFNEFINDVVLTYDQLNNELYISSKNAEIGYSYVFNLDTKAYHKVNKRYLESSNSARYVIEIKDGIRNIVDLHTEIDSSEQPILLQSRPMALDVLYTHIQRLQMFVDAKLEGGQNLCLSVFGSDNLYDWKCIISSQKQNTVLRQITTNRAAKSYKDYVILINGTVSTDTDLSEIIADYTVVSRRLG